MRILKVTAEYRAESEEEAKQMNEDFKKEAREQGYILNSFAYTKKKALRIISVVIIWREYT